MLGELIYQGSGKRIVRTVLSTDPLKIEVSFEEKGKLLGADMMEIGTYTSGVRPDGSLYGEGQGAVIGAEGMVTWKGSGVGTVNDKGAAEYRGAIFYQSTSPKFARLNTIAGVFEFGSDEAGNTHSKVWEWK